MDYENEDVVLGEFVGNTKADDLDSVVKAWLKYGKQSATRLARNMAKESPEILDADFPTKEDRNAIVRKTSQIMSDAENALRQMSQQTSPNNSLVIPSGSLTNETIIAGNWWGMFKRWADDGQPEKIQNELDKDRRLLGSEFGRLFRSQLERAGRTKNGGLQ